MLAEWKIIRDETADDWLQFAANASELAQTQAAVLKNILEKNKTTHYGVNFNFNSIECATDYQAALPIVKYDDIEHLIEAQSQGHSTLCAEPVAFYEKTSGSTSGPKLLPFTPLSLKAVQRAVNPWLFDLTQHRAAATQGRSYWSISPTGRTNSSTPDGTPVGAPSDLAFLTESIQGAFVNLVSVPPQLVQLENITEWRYRTLFALLADEKLSLISVWNPSFLTILIDAIPSFSERFNHDLTCLPTARSVSEEFWEYCISESNKASILERLNKAIQNNPVDTRTLWPHLDTISCWTHGSSARAVATLKQMFPHTYIQPKGLLATEAVVSFPVEGCPAPVLAASSAFFEFIDSAGNIQLAHQLEAEQSYEVVVTTYGGLYRYALGDVVTVRGYFQQLPCLEFIGRKGIESDLCGEKLNDAFVATCLNGIKSFSMLAPYSPSGANTHYYLLLDAHSVSASKANLLCKNVEQALGRNPQYAHARHLGQLNTLSALRINALESRFLNYQANQGLLLGEIKAPALCIDLALTQHLISFATEPMVES